MELIGKILAGRYEIIEKIGEGGMAYVFKARDNLLNRNVAVKVLKEESSYGSPVCFAVGSDWSDGDRDLRYCMHVADEAMYADKKEAVVAVRATAAVRGAKGGNSTN